MSAITIHESANFVVAEDGIIFDVEHDRWIARGRTHVFLNLRPEDAQWLLDASHFMYGYGVDNILWWEARRYYVHVYTPSGELVA